MSEAKPRPTEGRTGALIAARVATDEFSRDRAHALTKSAVDRGGRRRSSEDASSAGKPAAPAEPSAAPGDPLFLAAAVIAAAGGFSLRTVRSNGGRPSARHPIESIAEASHIMVRRVLLRDRWWQGDAGDLIGFLRPATPTASAASSRGSLGLAGQGAPPVALLAGSRGYTLVDPVTGKRTTLTSELSDRLEPEAYLLYPPLPKGDLSPTRLAAFALRGARLDLIFVGALALAATLAGLVAPLATGFLIDRALPFARRSSIHELGGAVLGAALARAAFEVARSSFILRATTRAAHRLQTALWDRVLRLDAAFLRRLSTVDIHERVLAFQEIRQRLFGTAAGALFAGLVVALNLALMFVLSPPLAACAVGIAAAGAAIAAFLARGPSQIDAARPGAAPAARSAAAESLLGITKLRAAAAEERALARWSRRAEAERGRHLGRRRRDDRLRAFDGAFAMVANVGVLAASTAVVGPEVEGRELWVGGFLAFYAAFGLVTTGATSLAKAAGDLVHIRSLWRRVEPLLAARQEDDEQRIDPGELRGAIRIEAATFRYEKDGPQVLDRVSLAVAPGECVAIVGASGSGKSTIIRLLLGFEAPETGQVLFDDQDLATLDVAAVRRQIGVVLQSSRLSQGSIYENIAGGAALTLDEARSAAVAAGLADDLEDMPMGLHTVLSDEGANLSGGQRQRLLIARAIARRPRILLFDEATSALDNRTQAMVGASLARLAATRIVVAHRLSTIRSADRIYVVDAGKIVQTGTFEQLVHEGGRFRMLMQRQSEDDAA